MWFQSVYFSNKDYEIYPHILHDWKLTNLASRGQLLQTMAAKKRMVAAAVTPIHMPHQNPEEPWVMETER